MQAFGGSRVQQGHWGPTFLLPELKAAQVLRGAQVLASSPTAFPEETCSSPLTPAGSLHRLCPQSPLYFTCLMYFPGFKVNTQGTFLLAFAKQWFVSLSSLTSEDWCCV